jgi:hypothetical protein
MKFSKPLSKWRILRHLPSSSKWHIRHAWRSTESEFAIKHTEEFAPRSGPLREAGLQLLDALQRLETVDRQFQDRSRTSPTVVQRNLDRNNGSPQRRRDEYDKR